MEMERRKDPLVRARDNERRRLQYYSNLEREKARAKKW